MKAKFVTFFVLALATVFTGCKNDKNAETTAAPAPVDNTFKVSLKVILKKNDSFSLFYTEDGTTNFTTQVKADLAGKDGEQDAVFTLPVDVFPTQLRIDLGMTPDQPDIVLKSIVFQYQGKTREVSGSDIGNFFRPDENKCTFDRASGTITALVKDGKRQFPSLYPIEPALAAELEKLAK